MKRITKHLNRAAALLLLGMANNGLANQECDPRSGACVRELPAETDNGAPSQNMNRQNPPGSTMDSIYGQTNNPSNLTINENEDQMSGAFVREFPQERTWIWGDVPPSENDIPTVTGENATPQDVIRSSCARSPTQALSWLSGPATAQDDDVLNRALAAWNWRGSSSNEAEYLTGWIFQWPGGTWQQQKELIDGETGSSVQRYRYVEGSGQVFIWVRATQESGCWMLSSSPPKASSNTTNTNEDINQNWNNSNNNDKQLNNEDEETSSNLKILWDSNSTNQQQE